MKLLRAPNQHLLTEEEKKIKLHLHPLGAPTTPVVATSHSIGLSSSSTRRVYLVPPLRLL